MTGSARTEYDVLFEPLQLGRGSIPNRFVFAAHQTNFATHHRFEKRHAAYYGARAAGGVGLIVLEGSVVHPSDWPYEYVIRGYDQSVVDGYRMMADTIHGYGARVFAHLTHSGMQGSSHYSQLPLWAPSPVPEVTSREMPKEMEEADLRATIDGFAQSARHAADGGLDGIEINAGQNSLIRQFLSPLTNQRTDAYGGDLDGRLRFAREVIRSVREAAGDDMVVGLRLAADEYAPWAGIKPEDAADIAGELTKDGVLDFVSVTSGSIYSGYQTRPGLFMAAGFAVPLAEVVKQAVSVPVFAQGSIVEPMMALAIVRQGQADAVEMTRALLADPELPNKLREGSSDDVRPCTLCNQACMVAQVQNPRLSCSSNPAAGYESLPEFAMLSRAPVRHRVMVVGAGPAGLEAARVAAERGHYVTIYERSDTLGGAVLLAAAAPQRQRLASAVEWLEAQVRKLNVPIQTGVEVTAAMVRDTAPGAVIVAVGGRSGRDPTMTIDADTTVLTPRQVMSGDVPDAPGKAVVIDSVGDQVGMAVSEWLAERGWQVEVVTSDMFVGQRLTATMELTPWHQRAAAKGIEFRPCVEVEAVSAGTVMGVDCFDRTPVRISGVDLVVNVVHEVPDEDLYYALKQSGARVFRAGDCVAPRAMSQAILEAYHVGREV